MQIRKPTTVGAALAPFAKQLRANLAHVEEYNAVREQAELKAADDANDRASDHQVEARRARDALDAIDRLFS